MTHLPEPWFDLSKHYIAGGVSTPLYDGFKNTPGIMLIDSAEGASLKSMEQRTYTDFVCGYGSLIFGHAHPPIVQAVEQQIKKGFLYVLPTETELRLSKMIVESSDCIDQIRFVCSGTEAVMTALRIAKHYTARNKILKFKNSYHGHADAALGKFYPEAQKGQFGIDPAIFDNTLVATYNDVEDLSNLFKSQGDEIAAVIIEPVACNAGLIKPNHEFLKTLRSLCDQHGSVLIFDEVITGFRFQYGPIANQYPIKPDLVTFGKIIGGGLSIGAYAGKKELMALQNSEETGFHFSGTFAANPMVMTAGLATLSLLANEAVYQELEAKGALLESLVNHQIAPLSNQFQLNRLGSVFSISLASPQKDTNSVLKQHSQLHSLMLQEGYLMTPSPYETMYISMAHGEKEIHGFVNALEYALKQCFL